MAEQEANSMALKVGPRTHSGPHAAGAGLPKLGMTVAPAGEVAAPPYLAEEMAEHPSQLRCD